MALPKEIRMTVRSAGETLHSTVMSTALFKPESGVLKLLKLDHESAVEIHKSDGTSLIYEFAM